MPEPEKIQFYLPPTRSSFLQELHVKTLKPRAYFVREAIRQYARRRGVILSPEEEGESRRHSPQDRYAYQDATGH